MLTKFPTYYVMAANTDVGKTIFSCGITLAAVKNALRLLYIKPVQTGFPFDSDSSFIKLCNPSDLVTTKTIFSLSNAVSPHRAMFEKNEEQAGQNVLDEKMLHILEEELKKNEAQFVLIEGAGGVASPTIDGQLQCDIYRNFRLPIIFVADSKLGGISTAISSIALLETKGFEIACVLLFAGKDENHLFLQKYYKNKFPVFSFKNLPPAELKNSDKFMQKELDAWYKSNEERFQEVFQHLTSYHVTKIQVIDDYIEVAKEHIWWPFTQHTHVSEAKVIDSAFKDHISYVHLSKLRDQNILTQSSYDASASWWTQGIGHASARLAHAAAMAAGRYGHVMFPGNIHEPAVKLTQKLMNTVGKGWAKRVFFSDNGSTAVEVALKIAFRKAFGVPATTSTNKKLNVFVLGLKDTYHGDTHATMNVTNPNSFKLTDYWYEPKGFWLDYPTIFMKDKKYFVALPEAFACDSLIELKVSELNEVFHLERLEDSLCEIYLKYIEKQMYLLESSSFAIGALLLEPILQGAGGMRLVDPLFQKLLVQGCKKRKIPVIFDEVFTGFWRLGKISAAYLMDEKPDIACYAKLLTGGLLPLSVTLTTEDCFTAFLGDNLSTALLHGHSYTAHPIGCQVAAEAIEETANSLHFNLEKNSLDIPWDSEIVNKISMLSSVTRVFALGTVFAFELQDTHSGYTSTRAKKIVEILREASIDVRSLGNVVYLFAGFNTKKENLQHILTNIYDALK